MKILLASSNPGKLAEISAILAGSPFILVLPQDLDLHLDIDETGATYLENASLKADAFCQASGLPALADDTGLEVDALNGAPGLHSARLIPNGTDQTRRAELLRLLHGKPRPWTAHFHCTAVLAFPDGSRFIGNGDCPGEIVPGERGMNGFGYDPIFQLTGSEKTLAEMTLVEKNQLSHRARAIHDLLANPELQQKFIPNQLFK